MEPEEKKDEDNNIPWAGLISTAAVTALVGPAFVHVLYNIGSWSWELIK